MNSDEQRLLQKAFSAKDNARLNDILARDEKKTDSLQSLIRELEKRFWAGVICIGLIMAVCIYGMISGHRDSLISYGIVLLLGSAIVYFVIPMNLAWKACKFRRRNNDGLF
ncbi:hypothetical protein [uncultured Pluralibacter sp.]|uniref:hypothetical protein n=1 Tax=uncultured Pluralibacter sp. TaxID=1490864 RepID=UPI002601ADD7|nr:hypothetical protein [uncultured Pluralibacter sp.]